MSRMVCSHDKHATALQSKDSDLVLFQSASSDTLDALFTLKFANGKEFTLCLHKQSIYSSSKGGPEAIAESYYSAMRAQQQSGGQQNETLARRTKLNWCLPSLKMCDKIIKESVQIYLKGDGVIKSHKSSSFFCERAKKYSVS